MSPGCLALQVICGEGRAILSSATGSPTDPIGAFSVTSQYLNVTYITLSICVIPNSGPWY